MNRSRPGNNHTQLAVRTANVSPAMSKLSKKSNQKQIENISEISLPEIKLNNS